MAALHWDRATGRLFLLNDKLQPVGGPWPAGNFVDSRSNGPWPPGTFRFDTWQNHPGDGPDSPFGTRGVALFLVAGRDGMGIHAGKASTPDALGRVGIAHCTFGCIRTTEEAMAAIVQAHAANPIAELTVT